MRRMTRCTNTGQLAPPHYPLFLMAEKSQFYASGFPVSLTKVYSLERLNFERRYLGRCCNHQIVTVSICQSLIFIVRTTVWCENKQD